jgi:hypothetical protein
MGILILILAISIFIAAIPCWCAWRLTKRLPIWLRLLITILITTLLLALICTPIGGAGEGGAWVLSLGMFLVSALYEWMLGAGNFARTTLGIEKIGLCRSVSIYLGHPVWRRIFYFNGYRWHS